MMNPAEMPEDVRKAATPMTDRLASERPRPEAEMMLQQTYDHSRSITEMIHKRLVLHTLIARLRRAEEQLSVRLGAQVRDDHPEYHRLRGKVEGVRLALSYIEEELR